MLRPQVSRCSEMKAPSFPGTTCPSGRGGRPNSWIIIFPFFFSFFLSFPFFSTYKLILFFFCLSFSRFFFFLSLFLILEKHGRLSLPRKVDLNFSLTLWLKILNPTFIAFRSDIINDQFSIVFYSTFFNSHLSLTSIFIFYIFQYQVLSKFNNKLLNIER